MAEQVDFIVIHLAVSLIVFLAWLLDKRYRLVFKENRALRAMLKELEGYKSPGAVLSYTHFLSHVNYIITATKRRGKKNHLLKAGVKENAEHKTSLEYILLDSATKKLRSNFFDLITQRVRNEVLIFLQDTTPEGCNTVLDRLVADLRGRVTTEDLPFDFIIYEIEDMEDIEGII